MKPTALLLSVLLLLCTGCASLERVGLHEPDKWLPNAQKDLLNKESTVSMRDGSSYEGKVVGLNADSIWLQTEMSRNPIALGMDRVETISPSRNVGMPIVGLVGGALLGGVIGGAIGTSQGLPGVDDPTGVSNALFGMPYGAAIGALAGGLLGGVVLGAVTSVTDYQLIYTPPRNPRPGSNPAMSDSTRNDKQIRR